MKGLASLVAALCIFASNAVLAQEVESPEDQQREELEQKLKDVELAQAYLKAVIPQFSTDLGKTGQISSAAAATPSFDVTIRAADSMEEIAKDVAAKVGGKCAADCNLVLLGSRDAAMLHTFLLERPVLSELLSRTADHRPPTVDMMAGGTLLALAPLIAQSIAGFSNLAKTDRELTPASTALPEEILLDLVAMELTNETYPSLGWPPLYVDAATGFGPDLRELTKRRLWVSMAQKKDLLAEVDAFLSRMQAADATTKAPRLLSVIYGEQVLADLAQPNVALLTLEIVHQGGSTMRTSKVWRGDRLYAQGGVIARYRLYKPTSRALLAAGLSRHQSGYESVPLGVPPRADNYDAMHTRRTRSGRPGP